VCKFRGDPLRDGWDPLSTQTQVCQRHSRSINLLPHVDVFNDLRVTQIVIIVIVIIIKFDPIPRHFPGWRWDRRITIAGSVMSALLMLDVGSYNIRIVNGISFPWEFSSIPFPSRLLPILIQFSRFMFLSHSRRIPVGFLFPLGILLTWISLVPILSWHESEQNHSWYYDTDFSL